MLTTIFISLAIITLVALFFIVRSLVGTYFEFRGKRVVICPETKAPAGVEVDARHAAFSSLTGETQLRLQECTRWPERLHCGQECLKQIEAAPAACLMRTILTNWYEGKACVLCGKSFGEIHWFDHKPALMSREWKIMEWQQVPAEKLYEVLATHLPICWNCSIAEGFRRAHPELVTDRLWQEQELHGHQHSAAHTLHRE
jgi:hypothetical protein